MKRNTVENIVNKYITYVAGNPVDGITLSDDLGTRVVRHGKVDAPSQLTTELYRVKRGDSANHHIVEHLQIMHGRYSSNAINQEDFNFLLENYKESIDFLYEINPKVKHQQLQAADWSDFLADMDSDIDFVPGSRIYVDPFDVGNLAIKYPNCKFSGYLRHPEFLQIRLDAHNIQVDLRDDVFHLVREEDVNSYDIVILDATQEMGYEYESAMCCWERLADNGRMFIRCGLELLQGGAEAEHFRKVIKEMKALSKVSFYPEQSIYNIEKGSFILVIDRSKKNDTVVMSQKDKNDLRSLQTSCMMREKDVDYNMLIPLFYLNQIHEDGTPLNEYCSLFKNQDAANLERKPIAPVFLSSNFSSAKLDGIEFDNELSEILCEREQKYKEDIWNQLPESTSPTPYNYIVVNQPCVVVFATGEEVRVGYITAPRKNGYMLYGVECLIPKNGLSVQDLAILLLTESVSRQIKGMTVGNARVSLTEDRLSKILVSCDKDKIIKDSLISELSCQRNEIKLIHEEYKKTIRMRKHSLGQIMFELNTCWELLKISRELNHGSLNGNFIIGEKHPKRVDDILNSVENCIQQLGNGIENFVPAEEIRFAKRERLSLLKFIKEYVHNHQSPNFTFVMEDIDTISKTSEDLIGGEIFFSKTALEEILQNIIYNAEKHGFLEEQKENKIKFSFRETTETIKLVISNNGTPIREDINLDDIFTYGFTTSRTNSNYSDRHSGIGLFFVKSLMCDFNGDVVCVRNYEKNYPVSFILKFNKII